MEISWEYLQQMAAKKNYKLCEIRSSIRENIPKAISRGIGIAGPPWLDSLTYLSENVDSMFLFQNRGFEIV